ncbi:MAG: TIGR00266 family protein [Dehalococcoidia bacterium]|nr:TIGR00266 family protein [Dehalococcoidia bacterium]
MHTELLYRPSYTLATVRLQPGESIVAEAGAMVSMSPTITMDTSARGGVLGGLARSFLGGESFFQNTFTASGGEGEVTFAPPLPGDIAELPMSNQTMLVQSGSYLACSPSISVDTKWGGARSFFAGEGLFLLKCTGSGTLLVSSFGAIHEKTLAPGERYIVDTGHIVAFADSMSYNVRRAGGLKSTVFGGEGLVVEFTGPGRLLIQTRTPGGFASWIASRLPSRRG